MADESKSTGTYSAARIHEFGGPENFRVDEGLETPTPGEGEVLIAVGYAGVNPVDTYIRAGTYARKPALPYTPGGDGAGIVQAVGGGVTRLKAGDRVYFRTTRGSYATLTVAKEDDTHKLPDSVTLAQGAAIGVPVFTAYRALFHSTKVAPGDWVLIHGGSGAVGTAAIQLAADFGCHVIATAGTEAGVALVKSCGAEVGLNHHDGDTIEKVMAATDGAGANVIVEMLANVNLGNDCKMLAKFGRVGVVGNRGEVTINARDLMARQASVVGVALAGQTPAQAVTAHAYVNAKLASGALKMVVGEEFAMADAGAAHVAVIEHKGGSKGKCVLKCAELE